MIGATGIERRFNYDTISAQELKRRGIAAVDDAIDRGDVPVVRKDRPQYVVLSEARYQELVAEAHEAYLARVRTALEDVKEGRVHDIHDGRGSAEGARFRRAGLIFAITTPQQFFAAGAQVLQKAPDLNSLRQSPRRSMSM